MTNEIGYFNDTPIVLLNLGFNCKTTNVRLFHLYLGHLALCHLIYKFVILLNFFRSSKKSFTTVMGFEPGQDPLHPGVGSLITSLSPDLIGHGSNLRTVLKLFAKEYSTNHIIFSKKYLTFEWIPPQRRANEVEEAKEEDRKYMARLNREEDALTQQEIDLEKKTRWPLADLCW